MQKGKTAGTILCLFLSLMLVITNFTTPYAYGYITDTKETDQTVNNLPPLYHFGSIEKALEENAQLLPNIGQLDETVAWFGNYGAGTVYIQKDGTITYLLLDVENIHDIKNEERTVPGSEEPHVALQGWVLKERFIGSNSIVAISGKTKGTGKYNFLFGDEKKKHKKDVQGYKEVIASELYPMIELLLSHKGNTIEKTFQLNPGSDSSAICIQMDGAQSLSVDENGNLVAVTELGNILFSEPKAWQEINGEKKTVAVKYWVDGNQYGFLPAEYNSGETLYIDPEIVSTYFGGTSTYATILDIAVDGEGNIYVTGEARYSSFPTTAGAYDTSFSTMSDGFVTKIDNNLSQILVSTFLGGSATSSDIGRDILIDQTGKVYIVLETDSSTFPIVGTPYDSTHNGNKDIAVVRMDSDLSTLECSTFIGGSSAEYVYEMIQNTNNDIIITGATLSTNYPTTAGAYQQNHKNGMDVFVSIISADLSSLLSSTLVGSNYADEAYSMALSPSGDIYISGATQSTSFPVTVGAFDITYNGGMTDAFVLCLDASLSILKASTFLGGSNNGYTYEKVTGISVLPNGNIAVTGQTKSSDFPVTVQAYDTTHNGDYDGFIAVFGHDLSNLAASTYIGGSAVDDLKDLKSDEIGTLYAVGSTYSDGFPITPDALDSTRSAEDAVLLKISQNLEQLEYSTFLGGSAADRAYGFHINDEGTLFIYGFTNSTNFPVTTGAMQTTNITWISFILKTPRDLTGLAAADWVRLDGLQPRGLNPGYGGYTFEVPVMRVTGARALEFKIGYNSILLQEGPVGLGWNHNFEAQLNKAGSGNVEIIWNQNRVSRFYKLGDGSYQPNIRLNPYESLTEDASGNFTLTERNGESYLFNSSGQLTQQHNKIGQSLSFSYNAANRLESITEDISGRTLTLSYNANGLLSGISDPLNRAATFTYDGMNRLITYTDAGGYETHYTYNAIGQVLTVTNDDGKKLLDITYDLLGRVIVVDDNLNDGKTTEIGYYQNPYTNTVTSTITNRNDTDLVLVYNAHFDLQKATDALNNATEYTYDIKGNVTSVTDANGYTTHFDWDTEGNLTRAYDILGRESSFTYDARHNILTVENALGKISEFAYDSSNNLIEYQDRLNNVTQYTYGSGSQLTQVTKPRDGITSITNQYGQAISVTPDGGSAVTMTYDAAGRLISKTDGAGKNTTYSYDAMDRLLSVTDPLNHSVSYTYDCDGNCLSVTDPLNNTTYYTYDQNNRLAQITDALNNTTVFAYDAEGNLLSITDAQNHTTLFAYDDNGRLISETDPLNHVKTYDYDEVGKLIQKKDALNNIIFSGTYDAVGNLLNSTDALSNTTQHTYDLLSRLILTEDPLSRVSAYWYDDMDRLILGTDASNGQSSLGYDADGNRSSLTDQNSQQTGFSFDLAGRLVSVTSAAGSSISYQYNNRELLSQITNGRQQTTTISYDDAGRILSITDPAGTISYSYDNAGNILTVSDLNGTLTRQYDALGRLTQYTDANSNTISYGYDVVGRLTTLTYPGNRQVTYTYNNGGRLISVTDWDNRQTQYTYDANDRLTVITRADGTHQTNTYNAKGQLTVTEDYDSQSALISRYEYTYDAVGNLTVETSTTGQGHLETNTFSNLNQITAQSVTENGTPTEQYSYTYDAGGNILTATNNGITTTFTYGSANHIATVNGQNVTYDADGNISNAPLNGSPLTFSFDCRNRLTGVGYTSYTYNAENQRVGITENGQATSYVINPNAALPQTLIKTSGGVSTYYVYGHGLVSEQTGTDYTTYHYDLRGSTVALTDSTGLVTDTFSYAPYGELLSHNGTSDVVYLYNGRDGVITDDNGLYYMRARYYHPELRRFLSEDEYAGRYDDIFNLNLYTYCEGNPIDFVDPSGNIPVETALDAISIGWSANDFISEPSLINFGFLVWDVAATALPYVPGSYVAKGFKALGKADDALDAVKVVKGIGVASSEALRRNLIKAGIEVPDYANAAHHIVAGTSAKAAEARAILQKFGLNINDAANGVFLPTIKGKGTTAYHPSLHTNAYYEEINNLLQNASSRQDVLDILKDIGEQLSNGTFMK